MQQVLFDEKMDGITIDRIRREDGFSMPSKHLHLSLIHIWKDSNQFL